MSSSNAAMLCPETKWSIEGSAACIPPVSGSYPERPLCGFTQTTRVRQPPQPRHLLGEQVGAAALPAVAAHDDDRPARRAALSPPVEERLEHLAQPGAARPVRDRRAARGQRLVGVALPHLAGDPGQPRADREHLGRRPGERGRRRARTAGARRRTATSSRRRRPAARRGAGGGARRRCSSRVTSPPSRSARRTVRAGWTAPRGLGRRRRAGRIGEAGASRANSRRRWSRSAMVSSATSRCRSTSSALAWVARSEASVSSSPSPLPVSSGAETASCCGACGCGGGGCAAPRRRSRRRRRRRSGRGRRGRRTA